MFGWEWKNERMKKVSLYKFTHIPMLKNSGQLIQKKWQITQKKNSSNLLKNKKHVPKKKSCLVKPKKNKKGKNKWTGHRHFCPLSSFIFSLQFSLHFEEKTFWWTQEKNTWAQPLIFLLLHLTKHTQKSLHSHFLSKIFHPPYFTSKQTYPKFEPTIEIIFLPQQ